MTTKMRSVTYALCTLVLLIVSVLHTSNAALIPLNDHHLNVLSNIVTNLLVDRINTELGDTQLSVPPLLTRVEQCKGRINDTVDECQLCVVSKCQTRIEECGRNQPEVVDVPPNNVVVDVNVADVGEKIKGIQKILVKAVKIVKTVKKILNPAEHVKVIFKGVKKITDKAKTVVKKTVGKIRDVAKDVTRNVGKAVKGLTKKVGGALKDVLRGVGKTTKKVVKKVLGGAHKVVKKVFGGVKTHVKKVVHSVGRRIKKIFGGWGRRRRSNLPPVPTCDSLVQTQGTSCNVYKLSCPSCGSLLSNNNTKIMAAVCGNDIVNVLNSLNQMATRSQELLDVYNTHLKNGTVISKVEYDPATYDLATGAFTTVFVTVTRGDLQPHRYQTTSGLKLNDIQVTGLGLSIDIWDILT